MNGRLLILGNTHPTNFGDIGDKFFWDYEPETGFTKTKCWDKKSQYLKVSVNELLELGIEYQGQNFIEVVGQDVDPELTHALAQAIREIWEAGDDRLFMVRNNVKFKQLIAETVDEGVQLEDVTMAITARLEDTDLLDLWQQHLEAARND